MKYEVGHGYIFLVRFYEMCGWLKALVMIHE